MADTGSGGARRIQMTPLVPSSAELATYGA